MSVGALFTLYDHEQLIPTCIRCCLRARVRWSVHPPTPQLLLTVSHVQPGTAALSWGGCHCLAPGGWASAGFYPPRVWRPGAGWRMRRHRALPALATAVVGGGGCRLAWGAPLDAGAGRLLHCGAEPHVRPLALPNPLPPFMAASAAGTCVPPLVCLLGSY